jgi:hypothetical protein
MWTAVLAFMGAIFGGVISGLVGEHYRRYRDMVATAAALAGELSSIRLACNELQELLPRLLDQVKIAGRPPAMPRMNAPNDIAYEAYIDKLGLLGSDLAERTSLAYGQIRGMRAYFFALTGELSSYDPSYLIGALDSIVRRLDAVYPTLEPLIEDLRQRAKENFHWWPFDEHTNPDDESQ